MTKTRKSRVSAALYAGIASALLATLALAFAASAAERSTAAARPNVVFITVDTLRYDRLSIHGHPRLTSPHIDALLAGGARFDQARVIEPLTAPSMTSMLTSLEPHEHGLTRNGLRMRPQLPSFGKILARRGYRTAAFIGNWTLKDQLSGLGEHFDEYHEIFTRKRWLGLMFGEATADDLTSEALEWLEEHEEDHGAKPFFLWVHYVEPHAPYRFHSEFAERLGLSAHGEPSPQERYDTEIAFVDRSIGRLLDGVQQRFPPERTLFVFVSDHGESLGEHGYWGHGRHLYDATLHIPMGITWEGRLEPRVVRSPATILDLAPTIFGLLGWPVPSIFHGYDYSPVLRGEADPPMERVTYYQAHKGAVQRAQNRQARRQGLLEVAKLDRGRKEILRVTNGNLRLFDLDRDRSEAQDLAEPRAQPSAELQEWLQRVREGLTASDELPPAALDEESIERLRALGYID